MQLHWVDWLLIAIYFLFSLIIGLRFRKNAGKNLTEYFLGGRNLPWYIAGISMVATTFAADTPLAVTELVNYHGISGNWLWWNMLIGGMLTTFFFAKYWRRSGVLTELEFIEFRYSGKVAAFLRGFKAFYLGIFLNTLIIGWVNLALLSILKVFFDIPEHQLIWYVGAAMLIASLYSTLSGLKGVAITDVVQFIIAITGSVVLAVVIVGSDKVGGISGMKEQLPEGSLSFFPEIGSGSAGDQAKALAIGLGAFFAYIGVQWWASWYPGAEPGGGGYVAQRMMSTKNEKHSVWATLFFQIAHYTIRPWPWILVGLATVIIYPDLPMAEKRLGYVMAINEYLPVGLKGLLVMALLAAYMSTISTQLNWGASFIINDLYKRFIHTSTKEELQNKADKHYVLISRITTLFIMALGLYITTLVNSISEVWQFLLECGAGLGLVLILRWYWWRINAWSELTATILPFMLYAGARFILNWEFPDSFFFTVGGTTIGWLLVTFITAPDHDQTLFAFVERVQPQGKWCKVYKKKGIPQPVSNIRPLLVCWISSVIMIYSILFASGKMIFQEWVPGIIWLIVAILSLWVLRMALNRQRMIEG